MTKALGEATMQVETRVRHGETPRTLLGEPLVEMSWHMRGEEFLLRGEGEHYFYYRKGSGITIDRGASFDASEESLWLNGSVYAAIASMNGLLPIHASAVAFQDRVFAFTGAGGAGKSTLVAALGDRGLPMFCDDTLILDLSDPEQILCLPGHKRLKLRPDALELTGALRQEKVSLTVDKYYAQPATGNIGVALPMARLIFLEDGGGPAIAPIQGAERLTRLQDDHQTTQLFAAARGFSRGEQFGHLVRLARQIVMARFQRSRATAQFDEGADLAAGYIMSGGKP